jgi:hypothetical protein
VSLHGRFGEVEVRGELGVRQATSDEPEYFPLAVGKPPEPRVLLVGLPAGRPLRQQPTKDGRCEQRLSARHRDDPRHEFVRRHRLEQ